MSGLRHRGHLWEVQGCHPWKIFWDYICKILQSNTFLARKIFCSAAHNAFLNSFTIGSPFPCVLAVRTRFPSKWPLGRSGVHKVFSSLLIFSCLSANYGVSSAQLAMASEQILIHSIHCGHHSKCYNCIFNGCYLSLNLWIKCLTLSLRHDITPIITIIISGWW